MARIRSIKPEIHLDEDLWDAEEETGLPLFRAFTGLWGQADREGRFEWRPRKLKAGVLPYSNDDFSRVLDALTTRGFVVRYKVGEREYGWVRTFTRHQVINGREAASILPAPPDDVHKTSGATSASTPGGRVDDASSTREAHARGEGKGREGKRTEGRVDDARTTSELLSREHEKRYVEKRACAPTKGKSYLDALKAAANWCDGTAESSGRPASDVIHVVLDGLFASTKPAIVGDWGMRFLGVDCAEFYAPPPPKSSAGQPEDPRMQGDAYREFEG